MPDDIIKSGLEFWNKLYQSGEVRLRFTKKDGTIRIMRCTLDFSQIPQKDFPKKNINIPKILKLLQQNKIIHVYDLDKKAWRSVPIDKVDYVQSGMVRYKVRVP